MKDQLRPENLEDYIGQEPIKDLLQTSMTAASHRSSALDHVLLNGPPGLGKTTLANIIGKSMGWKVKAIIGPSLGTSTAVEKLFMVNWKPKTILFIDEIHRMRKPAQEALYPVMEDNVLQFSTSTQALTDITIIGATTNMGRLERPFIDRFGLILQLEYYSPDELEEILHNSAEKLKVKPDFDAFTAMSYRSRGTPRIANNILKRIRDYSEVLMPPVVDKNFVSKIMTDKLHIDGRGLTPLDRRYLRTLNTTTPIGADAIATRLNEEVETIEDYVEPFLLRLGLIERRSNGRCLTSVGAEHIRSIPVTMDR